MKPQIRQKLNRVKKNVKQLQLSSARIKVVPIEVESLNRLKYLDLFGNSISQLPDWFYKLDKLENVSLKNNAFDSLPTILFTLKKLKNVNLADNKISNISSGEFRNLLEIDQVDLSHNSISNLPTDIGDYYKTTILSFSGNKLESFPKALSGLSSLKKLDLSDNEIMSFRDDDFDKLDSLEELDISGNRLTYLPSSIGKLTKLKKLNLSGNSLSHLPKEFENLINLRLLDMSGNPIENVPVEITAQGPQGIINYYLSLGDNVQLFEAKLLIVGQGSVGKTYLVNRLIKDSTPDTDTTEGIDINTWTIKTKSSDNFRINVWDFGGQEIYHSTHQFFLTKRSLYVLVWEARTDQHLISFDYWLNVIRLLSNDSPIIIVLNKIDERIVNIDERSLKDKFENIVAFNKVSASTGENIPLLISEISKSIDSLPLIGDKLPKVWVEIRSELEGLEENYISSSEYIKICNRYGLSNKRSLFLSQYFHDLGVFLHFQDDTLLKSIVFLKPEWATNAVYKILDAKSVIQKYGEFNSNMLDKILEEYESDKHPYIVRLMKKFELCFEVDENVYLAPELLTPEKQIFEWNKDNNLNFEYHYDFMPAGIMARFIVRTRRMVYDKVLWRNGVLLSREDTLALVESDLYAKKIRIRIDGDSASSMLAIIRREFDSINESLNYSNVPEKIPCNCPVCHNDSNPYLFNYQFIRKISNDNTFKTIPCEKSFRGVNVQNLLKLYMSDVAQNENVLRYSLDKILHDLIEVSSRILERKFQKRIEDLINDDVVDLLRMKGHNISDQTRSGVSESGSGAGEIDIMIRRDNQMPVTIIESFRLESCGSKNTIVSTHIEKLLSKYDTHGIKRNFILVFCEAKRFDNLWLNYSEYIKNLNVKPDFGDKYPLSGFSVKNNLAEVSNIKVGVSRHQDGNEVREIVHILLNMK